MPNIDRNDRHVLAAIALTLVATLVYAHDGGQLLMVGVLGAALLGLAGVAAAVGQGGALSQAALPVLGMGMVALTIHAARGHPEAHFAVFAFLAVVAVYRRVLPLLLAAGTIAVHHLSFNYFQAWGWGPICFTEPSLALVLEHAAYVVAETGVLVAVARRAGRDARAADELINLVGQLKDDQGRIRFSGLNQMPKYEVSQRLVESLTIVRAAIAQVQTSVSSIGSASQEVAVGSQDLSRRTEEAAANLERTASSVAQLTERVTHSNQSALTASDLAANAATVAREGGEVVGNVVRNMQDISESSRRIADIIGVIDGIAFQTNILALNAAVEAARAGEQGRGFAVVASEVRSLAGRSAQAAREIKDLIGASVEKVESGARLVESAGATMTDVVASVQRVSDMIRDISAATMDQSQEIQQVNQAVLQLDQMTQQNAALVEESSAAAESLQDQAGHLARAIERFDVQAPA